MKRIATALVASVALVALTAAPVEAGPRRANVRARQLVRQVERRASVQHAMTPIWAVGTHLKISFNAWQQKQMIKQRTRVGAMQRANHRAMSRNVRNDPYGRGYGNSRSNVPVYNSGAVYNAGYTNSYDRSRTPAITLRRW